MKTHEFALMDAGNVLDMHGFHVPDHVIEAAIAAYHRALGVDPSQIHKPIHFSASPPHDPL